MTQDPHSFAALVIPTVEQSLSVLEDQQIEIQEELQTSARTALVIGLKSMNWRRTIIATGLFSIFEAELQRELACANGFKECKRRLKEHDQNELLHRFEMYLLAINVLKHGYGASYDSLVETNDELPFRIKQRDEHFFFEGDVSEIPTLIQVDDDFLRSCAKLIYDISIHFLSHRFSDHV